MATRKSTRLENKSFSLKDIKKCTCCSSAKPVLANASVNLKPHSKRSEIQATTEDVLRTLNQMKKEPEHSVSTRRSLRKPKEVLPINKMQKPIVSLPSKPIVKNRASRQALKPSNIRAAFKRVSSRVTKPIKKQTDDDDYVYEGSSSESDSSSGLSENELPNKLKRKDSVKCHKCSFFGSCHSVVKKHISSVHLKNISYYCIVCDFRSEWKHEYYLHVKKHYAGPPFQCHICEYTSNKIPVLISHCVAHKKNITYKCSVCDFTCEWKRQYQCHLKTHFPGPPFQCDICKYTSDKISLLYSHRMRKHTKERPIKCEECPFSCYTNSVLACHMRCHTGEKPFQCEQCGRSFACRKYLTKHAACHLEDLPFSCETCGFRTRHKSTLKVHKQIHTGGVFRCHFVSCRYKSTTKSRLRSHLLSHSGVRSHVCPKCGRAFVSNGQLVQHARLHRNQNAFKCELCEFSGSRKDKLKEHLRMHHGENATAKIAYRPRRRSKLSYKASIYSKVNGYSSANDKIKFS